ncbi:3'-5' exonuclease [Aeromonas caviae]|nr:3'-5' exonuclease [Aeromonas caviae]
MTNDELEAARAAAIAEDRCFSKGRLQDEFRMKPKADAVPVAFYKNGYGGKFGVYKIADCVPMRLQVSSPVSDKQKRAREMLALKAKLKSNVAKLSIVAREWLNHEPLFLDTETTGLDDEAQIVELAITDKVGNVLIETRLRPTVQIAPEAEAIHNISIRDLAECPTWPDVSAQVRQLLASRPLVIFNADFDTRLLHQTATAFGEDTSWISKLETHCAMYLAADVFGSTNKYGSISLANAVNAAGVVWKGDAHGAVADTLATVDVVHSIAEISLSLERELAALTMRPVE